MNKTPEPGAHSAMGGENTRNSSNVLRNNFILKSDMAGLDRSNTFVIANEVGLQ